MFLSARMTAMALLPVLWIATSDTSVSAKLMQEPEQRKAATTSETGAREMSPRPPLPRTNPDASGKYHVGDGVSAPQVIYSVDAQSTDKARKKGLGGTCVIGMLVDATGTPQDVHVITSIADSVAPKLRSIALGLDASAVSAAKQFRFKPAMYLGKAVPVETTAGITFNVLPY